MKPATSPKWSRFPWRRASTPRTIAQARTRAAARATGLVAALEELAGRAAARRSSARLGATFAYPVAANADLHRWRRPSTSCPSPRRCRRRRCSSAITPGACASCSATRSTPPRIALGRRADRARTSPGRSRTTRTSRPSSPATRSRSARWRACSRAGRRRGPRRGQRRGPVAQGDQRGHEPGRQAGALDALRRAEERRQRHPPRDRPGRPRDQVPDRRRAEHGGDARPGATSPSR